MKLVNPATVHQKTPDLVLISLLIFEKSTRWKICFIDRLKILKKNFDLDEEGYDIARDQGRVKPSKDKKDGTSYPPSEEMKKTQKVNKGPSAFEIVKKKYGKAVMDVDKKKKEKK